MRRLLVAFAVLGLVACSTDGDTNATATTPATTALRGFGTTPVSMLPRSPQATLKAVRVGTHDGFVRVVFEFDVPPGFAVTPAHPPFTQDGSGAEVNVGGGGHLTVRFESARAHDDDGAPTVSTARLAGPSGGAVTEVVFAGDFEGVVNYVIGTTEPKAFKAYMLESPGRVVVDIASA